MLQGPHDSAHSFPAQPSLALPHIVPTNRTALRLVLPGRLLSSATFFFTRGPSARQASASRTLAACRRDVTPEALNPCCTPSGFQTFRVNAVTRQTLRSQSLKRNKARTGIPVIPQATPPPLYQISAVPWRRLVAGRPGDPEHLGPSLRGHGNGQKRPKKKRVQQDKAQIPKRWLGGGARRSRSSSGRARARRRRGGEEGLVLSDKGTFHHSALENQLRAAVVLL